MKVLSLNSHRAGVQHTRQHRFINRAGPTSSVALYHPPCSYNRHALRPSRYTLVCHALEQYMVDKLSAAESTFKELQLRMADPDVANNASEFQKVRMHKEFFCSCARMTALWPLVLLDQPDGQHSSTSSRFSNSWTTQYSQGYAACLYGIESYSQVCRT